MDRTLQQQICDELRRFCAHEDDVFAWLARPQQILNRRIPARMIASGEGAEVLAALRLMNNGARA